MAPPPYLVRRFVLAPLMVLLAIVLVPTTLMLAIVVGAVLTWVLPGRLRAIRVLWMAAFYVIWDAAAIVGLFVLWLASGCGIWLRADWCRRAHVRLARRMLQILFWQARWTLRLQIVVEADQLASRAVPLLVVSRHAGPGDSFILVHELLDRGGRAPAIVLKDSLQWDPAVDILLNRLPSAFVTPAGRRKPGQPSTRETISRISGELGGGDALVLFPEGGNVTPGRRARRIESLRASGELELADRAEAMTNVMAPHAGGFATALEAMSSDGAVLVVAHTGLEQLVTMRDIWRELPMDKTIVLGGWVTPIAELPSDPVGRAAWLFDQWVEVDRWIEERAPADG